MQWLERGVISLASYRDVGEAADDETTYKTTEAPEPVIA
jgi:hypothetical protein